MPARPKPRDTTKKKTAPAPVSRKKTPAKSKSAPKNSKTPAKQPQKAKEMARLVINECGQIVFADAPLFAGAVGMHARDYFTFASPEDAQHDRPVALSDHADAWTAAILDGDHDIILTNGKRHTIRFDRMKIPGRGNFLIAAEIDTRAKKQQTDLAGWMNEIVIAPEPEKPSLKLVAASDHLSPFLDMTHDLILLMDRDGTPLHINETFGDVLGYTLETLSGMNFIDLVHPEDRSHIRPTFKSMMQDDIARDGRLIAFECRIVDAHGNPHWLEWRQRRTGDRIYAVCRDLTDSKSHEEQLIRHQQQLSEAQSIGHMGHWRWAAGDDRIFFSDEIYRIFGVSPEKFTPTISSVNSLLHRRDIGRMAQAFQRAMIERKNYEMEFRIIRPDGHSRFIILQGRCEKDDDGDVCALFGVMQDVTERVQNERDLRDAKEAAERAYAAKSQFLANMSHELRTPLNAIIGFSEMMQRQLLGPIGTEKYLDYIGNIRESGEHLLDLITDILDMSKIEAGKYELDLEEFNLLKVLRLACHMIEGRALDAQVKIICDVREDDFIDIVADRRAIMQIMLNLLSNAVKFTEPGGEVRAEFIQSSDSISVRVTDTGIGIPASKLRYVTEPFEQAANHFTRNHEGSGLGLAITKELIELHGGALAIESTVGVGTSVTFSIPKDCANLDKKSSGNVITAKFG